MQFDLSTTSQDVRNAVGHWVERQVRKGRREAFDRAKWDSFAALELLGTEAETLVSRCVGLAEAARAGLPGPVLEAQIALLADPTGTVRARLADGEMVTSLYPGPAGPSLVAWGAVADVVVDPATARIVADGPLPAGHFAYPVPHGWYQRREPAPADPFTTARWLYGAVLLGGLCRGAVELTADYVKERKQFGNPLAAYQAIQFPLAECLVLTEGAWLSALDAATRTASNDPKAAVSSALAFLGATQVARRVTQTCHQAFGAFGFCNEAGLVDLTWAMSWLRLRVGERQARAFLTASRRMNHVLNAAKPPENRILEGFSIAAPGHS